MWPKRHRWPCAAGCHALRSARRSRHGIFAILKNRAKTRAQRERRSLPFSALEDLGPEPDEPAVDPARFRPPDDPHWPGHWHVKPASWEAVPEHRLLSLETLDQIKGAIQALPPNQRAVITLRDMEGFSAEDVCNALGLTETKQRVLLHRALEGEAGARAVFREGFLMADELACRELVEIVTAYFEGALPPDEQARFDAHLAACSGCRTYVEQMRQTIWLTGRLAEEVLPAQTLADLLAIFRDWKKPSP